MLTEIYVDALLVDEELADQVWEAWDTGRLMTKSLGGGGSLYQGQADRDTDH